MKSQHHVKILSRIRRESLRIVQFAWIGLTLLAAIVSDASGTPREILAAGVVLAILPAIAGFWVLSDKGPNARIASAVLVLCWSGFAAVAILATGGAGSSLTILFALGPLTALALGHGRLAIESAVFSLIAFIMAIMLVGLGWIGPPGEKLVPMMMAGALAGTIQIAGLVWAISMSRKNSSQSTERQDRTRIIAAERALEKERENRKRAEAMLAERTGFFAGIGHELKTPLNAILGFSEMMSSELRGPLSEDYQDYSRLIHESGQDLMLLVEDILALAKAEANGHKLDLEPVDLDASGRSVLAQMQAMAARADVSLKLRAYGEPWALADVRAVRQIWQNLVSNAVKYSEAGACVSLVASVRQGKAVLSVKDTGAGMSEEDLARIAEPFAQGANAKGRAGTGLGLAVVKRFADLQNGKVIINTALGQGTQVEVFLPLADPEDLAPLG